MRGSKDNLCFGFIFVKCRDNSYYSGHTDNLDNRLFQHQNKLIPGCYTSTKLPVQLVYAQEFATREESLAVERQIKGWIRRKKEALINRDWIALSTYSMRLTEF